MASSDDEVDDMPEFVSDYHFVDEEDVPVSFSALPFQWSPDEILGGEEKKVFLHGTTDGGLRKIFLEVASWKFDISHTNIEISVFSRDNHWIRLQKPKKSFERIIRTTLITVNCLHIAKKNPGISEKSLWDQLSKIFSMLELRPSVNDLVDQMNLIEEAFRRDQSLSKSKFIAAFLEEKPRKTKVVDEDVPQKGFIVDDDSESEDDFASDGDDGNQLFDSVCAICDNGGSIIPCDGVCMRSFHTTKEDALKDAMKDAEEDEEIEDISICSSLGLSKKEIQANPNFTCKNCLHKQHQCFSCGQLGSSDAKSSGVVEVFQCASATCGYFYHPGCVAKLFHPDDEAAAKELEKNIVAGVPFTCPSHNCCVCKHLEDHLVPGLQFAVCRRCPTSYHRKCLPREISFEATEDTEQRAWEELLHINDRILIYCLKHEIDEDLGTPLRNHLKFPGEPYQKQSSSPALLLKKGKVISVKKSITETKELKKVAPDTSIGKSLPAVREGQLTQFNKKNVQRSSLGKRKVDGDDSSGKPGKKIATKKKAVSSSSFGETGGSFGEGLFDKYRKQSESERQNKFVGEDEPCKAVKTISEQSVRLDDELDQASKKKIEDLFKQAESSITTKSICEKYSKLSSSRTRPSKCSLDSYKQGRVEVLAQAVQTALKKLDNGCDIKEAKAVCGPNDLNEIFRWKNKLAVHIAPFIYGMRYTSFGRHFTKVEKLEEIVDKMHWYIEDGDTVVDFCCGANDFSCLMKDKLEQTGKKCFYRNFDIMRPKVSVIHCAILVALPYPMSQCGKRLFYGRKQNGSSLFALMIEPANSTYCIHLGWKYPLDLLRNDFCFERKNWMSVKPHQLPTGSKLVMGLNPPFGVKAALANQFINKALQFNPKLIILIVPQETERLDKKKPPYDLVWEDSEKLSGRSFYLPGSVDVHDKPIEDWNVVPPVLYLWSRRDFSSRMRAIAEKRGHIHGKQDLFERHEETAVPNQLTDSGARASRAEISNDPERRAREKQLVKLNEEVAAGAEDRVEDSAQINKEKERRTINGSGGSASKKKSRKRQRAEKNRGSEKAKVTPGGSDRTKPERPSHLPDSRRTPQFSRPSSSPAEAKMSKGRGSVSRPSHPYSSRPSHSPADSKASRRSSQDHFSINEESPLAEGRSGDIGPSRTRGSGFSETAYRYSPQRSRSSADPLVFSQSSRDDQLLGNEIPALPMETPLERYGGSGGLPQPSYQYDLEHRTGPSGGYLVDNYPRSYNVETENPRRSAQYEHHVSARRHHLDGYMGGHHQPYSTDIESRYATPPPRSFRPEPSSYGPLGMSALERHTARLDELNRLRSGGMGPPDLPSHSHGGIYDYQGSAPPYQGAPPPVGFAPGPRSPFPHQGSGGWIEE